MSKKKEELIHYAECMTFAAVWTACGQGMQAGNGKWHPDVNQWGQIGITKTKGWKLITIDKMLVTCPKCKRRIGSKRRVHNGRHCQSAASTR